MKYIEEVEDLSRNIESIRNSPLVAVDTETTGLSPLQDHIRLLQLSNGEETLVIDVFKVGKEATAEFVKPIFEDKNKVKLLHNAKFDVKFIKHELGIDVERLFDSYLSSLLVEGGLSKPKGYHSLEQVVKRYLDKDIDKSEQKSNWTGALTQSQLEYAAKDVEILFSLRETIIPKLQQLGLIKCAKLEFETVLPTAWLELCGFYLDFDQWIKVAESNRDKALEIADLIYAELAPVIDQGSLFGETRINLNSPQQVQKYFKLLGVPMPESTREFFLNPLRKEYPIVQKLIDYKGYNKAHTSFGENYREFVDPVTGRIHADFMQMRAGTGRYGVARPNLTQIPSDPAHRNCFKAEHGNSLIISDFSQEELRLLAEFSQDKKFQEAFRQGDDFHKATAGTIFKIPLDQVDKEARDLAKRMNFLLTYGGGAEKFSMSAGIPVDEASNIIKQYFSTFKSVDRWLKFQKQQVLSTKYSRSISGRMAKYEFDMNDGKSRSHAQREGANMPMQGSGADLLKRSMRLFYDKTKAYHPDIKLVNIVHDELVAESRKDLAEMTKDLLEESMKEAWYESVKSVDIKIDSKVMDYWEK